MSYGIYAGRLGSRPRSSVALVSPRSPRAMELQAEAAFYAPTRTEDAGYQQVYGNKSLGRDLDPTAHQRMIESSYRLFRFNGMGKRTIGLLVDFVIGSGIEVLAKDERVAKVIRNWWIDPHNNWPKNSHRRFRDLFIYGEWLHVPVTGPRGKVWINVIQPSRIKQVIPSDYSHEVMDKVILREILDEGQQKLIDRTYRIIRPAYNRLTGDFDSYDGDVFFFKINDTTDATRGIGELFPHADYLDILDEMLYNRAEKVANGSAMWWDVELQGMNEDQIAKWLERNTQVPPRPGSVFGHNEGAKLTPTTLDTKPDQAEKDVALLRSHIIGSSGFPGTFYDSPGSAGRAVAQEMAEPVYRGIVSIQAQIREILRDEINYVLWRAQDAGVLPRYNGGARIFPYEIEYHISFPRPSSRDIQRTGPAVARLAQGLAAAVKGGLITLGQAQTIIIDQVNALDLSSLPMEAIEEAMLEDKREAEAERNRPQPKPGDGGNGDKTDGDDSDDDNDKSATNDKK